jgi:hypothetical protein
MIEKRSKTSGQMSQITGQIGTAMVMASPANRIIDRHPGVTERALSAPPHAVSR